MVKTSVPTEGARVQSLVPGRGTKISHGVRVTPKNKYYSDDENRALMTESDHFPSPPPQNEKGQKI